MALEAICTDSTFNESIIILAVVYVDWKVCLFSARKIQVWFSLTEIRIFRAFFNIKILRIFWNLLNYLICHWNSSSIRVSD